MTNSIEIRWATPDDAEALASVDHRAFRIGRDESTWVSYFREHPGVAKGETVMALSRGRHVGDATALALEMAVCGRDLPVRGVAAVGVPPEHRRQGVADAMMRALLERAREKGVAFSLLHAFRMSYYARFGYGLCERWDDLRVRPSQLPASRWRSQVEPAPWAEHEAEVRAVYERSRAGTTGPLRRDDYWWRERVMRPGTAVMAWRAPESGAMEGYLLYTVPPEPAYPSQHFVARELVALTPRAREGLVGALEALGEQYALVKLALPAGGAARVVRDFGLADASPAQGDVDVLALSAAGCMGRVVDLPAALSAHPLAAMSGVRARFGLDLVDPLREKPERYDVEVDDGGIRAVGEARATERVTLRVDRFAQLYFRAASAVELYSEGAMEGSFASAMALDRALQGPAMFCGFKNAF